VDWRVKHPAYAAGRRRGEIARRDPAAFPEVAAVDRRKRQALDRLQRDGRLRSLLPGVA
jgi:hypothetical protein